jgi:hypothetical protein
VGEGEGRSITFTYSHHPHTLILTLTLKIMSSMSVFDVSLLFPFPPLDIRSYGLKGDIEDNDAYNEKICIDT